MMTLMLAIAAAAAPLPPLDALRWQQRVLLVCAPTADDPALARQQEIVAGMAGDAAERDLVLVTVAGDRVTGAGDTAAALRRRCGAARGFSAALIGKDGGTKLRARGPIAAAQLVAVIDAMPMRRGGGG